MAFFEDLMKGLGKGLGFLPGGEKAASVFDTAYGLTFGGEKQQRPEMYRPPARIEQVPLQTPPPTPPAQAPSPMMGAPGQMQRATPMPEMDRALQAALSRYMGGGRRA